jgi:hypothetical protein
VRSTTRRLGVSPFEFSRRRFSADLSHTRRPVLGGVETCNESNVTPRLNHPHLVERGNVLEPPHHVLQEIRSAIGIPKLNARKSVSITRRRWRSWRKWLDATWFAWKKLVVCGVTTVDERVIERRREGSGERGNSSRRKTDRMSRLRWCSGQE